MFSLSLNQNLRNGVVYYSLDFGANQLCDEDDDVVMASLFTGRAFDSDSVSWHSYILRLQLPSLTVFVYRFEVVLDIAGLSMSLPDSLRRKKSAKNKMRW